MFQGVGIRDLDMLRSYSARCFNKAGVYFMGQSDKVVKNLPVLSLNKCKDKNLCKSNKEIETFLQDKQLAFAMKNNIFHREKYEESETIQSITRPFIIDIPTNET